MNAVQQTEKQVGFCKNPLEAVGIWSDPARSKGIRAVLPADLRFPL